MIQLILFSEGFLSCETGQLNTHNLVKNCHFYRWSHNSYTLHMKFSRYPVASFLRWHFIFVVVVFLLLLLLLLLLFFFLGGGGGVTIVI